MGSVSSASSGLSNLLQTLRAESPQLSSMLSTPKVQSALEKASPGDLVELSNQALQLQQVGLLFGALDGTQSTGLTPGFTDAQSDPLAQSLDSSFGVTSSSTPSTGTLFGTAPTVSSLLNMLG